MKKFIFQSQWNWLASGVALGIVFLLAVALVKPIGVSTQFVILDGIIWNMFSNDLVVEDSEAKSGYSSSNAYLNKSGGKYAKNVAKPVNYSFIFVVAMIAGGFIAGRMQSEKESRSTLIAPAVWQQRFGNSSAVRLLVVFIGGFLVLFGSRLAGGCTLGLFMSGSAQLAISGLYFGIVIFGMAMLTSRIVYGKTGKEKT